MVKLEKLHVSYEKFLEHTNWSLNGLEDILAAHLGAMGSTQHSLLCLVSISERLNNPPRDYTLAQETPRV